MTTHRVLMAMGGLGLILLSMASPTPPLAAAPPGSSSVLQSDTVREWTDLSTAVDQLFADYDEPFHPGGVAAVVYGGELIHLQGYGAANREFDVPWTADTRYRIASMTKSFLAHALLTMQDRGQLHLDDPVRRYLPDFPDYGVPMTLRHLLQMSSGLWQDEHVMIFAGSLGIDRIDGMYELSRRQKALAFTPGSYYQSADVNPRILARVMEVVSGKAFPEVMHDVLFEPLGLATTSAPQEFSKIFDLQATTYTIMPDRDWPPNHVRVWIPLTGGGSIITTMTDLITWTAAVTRKRQDGLSYFDRMTAPLLLPNGDPAAYRLGVYMISHRGMEGWGHGGHTGTQYVHFPEIDLTIALFTNYLGGIDSTELLRGMIDAFLSSRKNPHTYYLSGDNPAREHRFLMPPAPLAENQVAALLGTWVEWGSGYVLTMQTRNGDDVRAGLLRGGGGAYLVETGPGQYASDVNAPVQRIRIAQEACEDCTRPALLVLNADWETPRRFERVTPLDLDDFQVDDYTGRFYSEELDVFHSVRHEESALVLRMGSGLHGMQRFELTPLGGDVFEGRAVGFGEIATHYVAVKFERDGSGRIGSMRLSADSVRDLLLQKVN